MNKSYLIHRRRYDLIRFFGSFGSGLLFWGHSVYASSLDCLKRDDWKRGSYRVGVENARLENAGPSYRWVENARPVAMERRWYQCCKTEMDVVVRCRKHTRIGNILYAVINSCRKKYKLLTQSELKSLRKTRMHQKSAKTPFCENCKRNVSYFILSYYRRTQN